MQSLFCLSLSLPVGDFSPAMQMGGVVTLFPFPLLQVVSSLQSVWQSSPQQQQQQLLPPVLTVCTFGYKLRPELALLYVFLAFSIWIWIVFPNFSICQGNYCEIKMFFIVYYSCLFVCLFYFESRIRLTFYENINWLCFNSLFVYYSLASLVRCVRVNYLPW